MKKIILTVLITAVVALGGVYLYQNFSVVKDAEVDSLDTVSDAAEEAVKEEVELDLLTYSSDKYSFQYPKGYSVEEPVTEPYNFPALTIAKEGYERNMEIFKISDFPGNDRPHGFTGEETQKDIDGYVPKETLTKDGYDVWLYYSESDTQIQEELKAIYDSIAVK